MQTDGPALLTRPASLRVPALRYRLLQTGPHLAPRAPRRRLGCRWGREETDDYYCGDVGMEEDMRALLDDACLCLSCAVTLECAEPP